MKQKTLPISNIIGLAEKFSITKEEALQVINHMPPPNEDHFEHWKNAVTGLRWHNFSVAEIIVIVEKINNEKQKISDVAIDMIPWSFFKKAELKAGLEKTKNTSIIAHIVGSGKIEEKTILNTLKKHDYDLEILIHAINCKQLSKVTLKQLGNKFQKPHVWHTIVLTGRFTNRELLNIGKKAQDDDVWIAIIKIGELNERQLLDILNHTKDKTVKGLIQKHGDFSFQEKQLIES